MTKMIFLYNVHTLALKKYDTDYNTVYTKWNWLSIFYKTKIVCLVEIMESVDKLLPETGQH